MRLPVSVMNGSGVGVGASVGTGIGVGVGANAVAASTTAEINVAVASGPLSSASPGKLNTIETMPIPTTKTSKANSAQIVRCSICRLVLGVNRGGAACPKLGVVVRRIGSTEVGWVPNGRSNAFAKSITPSYLASDRSDIARPATNDRYGSVSGLTSRAGVKSDKPLSRLSELGGTSPVSIAYSVAPML
ncbi:MAG: hypothetical protein DWQ04_30850 [Chloroflexi bacterium]|nr:MAG: hypothetical protein DWQ04_30850 [Chloroflexota bacterium]